jgi:hypothetical protein
MHFLVKANIPTPYKILNFQSFPSFLKKKTKEIHEFLFLYPLLIPKVYEPSHVITFKYQSG